MSILTTILSPPFLVNNIELMAFVVSVMILVIFDDFVSGKIIFPLADYVRHFMARGINTIYEKREIKSKFAMHFKNYISQAFATLLFILYCYIGGDILGTYVIAPILQRWQGIILIVVIIMFLLLNYLVNNSKMRRRFFGFGINKPAEKK